MQAVAVDVAVVKMQTIAADVVVVTIDSSC